MNPLLSLLRYSLTVTAFLALGASAGEPPKSHIKARWDPLHFKPAIETATNEQCLACHQEIMQRKPLEVSPAGVKASEALAWYQTGETYEGEQDTFHRRHLATPLARELMDLKCNTCHQGHDGNKEVTSSIHVRYQQPALLKEVDPDICLMCHGTFDYRLMAGLAGPWEEVRETFKNDCMVCHKLFRSNAHKVNYLKPEAIEKAGTENGEICYGCHGGRAWYRIAYPYPRNPWLGMPLVVPDWAKDRPTRSQPRFLTGMEKPDAINENTTPEEEN